MSRSLPAKNNPLISAVGGPSYEELVARRRLGKTNLSVKAAQIGTSNATKPENLGLFEYAHLRAPLPTDLKGSEIFPSHPSQHPETYFLMRRSKDGYVSATGMFKIAFPWAKLDEEKAEREHLKSRSETSQDEVAGNVWISPELALELAKEYKMYLWVRALLDNADIVQSPSNAKKQITPPPKFELPPVENWIQTSASSQRTSSRRSVSPSKMSPAKSRRAKKEITSTPSTSAANASLQSALDMSAADAESMNGAMDTVKEETEVKTATERKSKGRKSKKTAAGPEEDKKAEKKKKKEEKVKAADAKDKAETTQTTFSIDMPITFAEVPTAAETEEMIAKARGMVEGAIKEQTDGVPGQSASVKVTKKRKPEDEDEETAAESALRAKKAKVLEDKLKRERVRNRALVGVSAAFALAASIPYFL